MKTKQIWKRALNLKKSFLSLQFFPYNAISFHWVIPLRSRKYHGFMNVIKLNWIGSNTWSVSLKASIRYFNSRAKIPNNCSMFVEPFQLDHKEIAIYLLWNPTQWRPSNTKIAIHCSAQWQQLYFSRNTQLVG